MCVLGCGVYVYMSSGLRFRNPGFSSHARCLSQFLCSLTQSFLIRAQDPSGLTGVTGNALTTDIKHPSTVGSSVVITPGSVSPLPLQCLTYVPSVWRGLPEAPVYLPEKVADKAGGAGRPSQAWGWCGSIWRAASDCAREALPKEVSWPQENGRAPILSVSLCPIPNSACFSSQKPYICKIPGCTKRYTDPSSLRKHVKTVHGPDAHVTKKQRNDVHVRAALLKENGESEASAERGGRGSEDGTEASSTSQAVEDCLHIKAIKTESAGVSGGPGARPPEATPRRRGQFQSQLQPWARPHSFPSTRVLCLSLQFDFPPFTTLGLI